MNEGNWRELLKEKLKDGKIQDELNRRIGEGNVRSYLYSNERREVPQIPMVNRAIMYKITGIEELKPEVYFDPEKFKVDMYLSGELKTEQLKIWLGYIGKSLMDISQEAKISADTMSKFANGGFNNMKDGFRQRIVSVLKQYEPTGETKKVSIAIDSQTRNEQVTIVNPVARSGLEVIARGVEELVREVRKLGGNYKPVHQQRIWIIDDAMDTIIAQLEYYRTAPQKERDELALSLDINRWGWMINVLGGISKKEGPETFARHTQPPRKERRK